MTRRARLTTAQQRTLATLKNAVESGNEQQATGQAVAEPYDFPLGVDDEGRKFEVHTRRGSKPPRRPARQVSRRRSRD